ncbi:MAG TPA: CidA/LrgA family protein [Acetobacteraceae bacterium]|nr:CidA/LrgA family protein [Acetobacteraceae bacterium]
MLPVPGPVIALVLLYANLTWLGRIPENLGALADRILQNLGLLFVPAGAGIVAYVHLLRTDLVAIIAALLGGTIVTIGLVGVIADRLTRGQQTGVVHDATT